MKDPTDTRNIGPRVGSPLWIHMTAVTIGGAVGFVLAVTRLMDMSSLAMQPLFWVVAAMVVLGDFWPIVTPGRSSVEAPLASVTFSFAMLIAWGLPVAVLVRATSTMVTFLAKRKAPHRAAFNAAANTLSLTAGGSVLFALGLHGTPSHPWMLHNRDLGKVLLAAVASFVVFHILINVAVASHSREPVLRTLIRTLPYEAFVNLVL